MAPENVDQSLIVHDALDYRDKAWHLIPLVGKQPANQLLPLVNGKPSWLPLLDRPLTYEEIKSMFSQKGVGIGVLTGVSGIVVVDCDSRDEAVWWWKNKPRTGMMAKTGRGLHFIYSCDRNDRTIGNRSGLFGRKIDVRGFGGYVRVPPSMHENGTRYAWVGSTNLIDLAPFDRNWLSEAKTRTVAPALRIDGNRNSLRRYIAKIRSRSGSGGHNAAFRCAFRIAQNIPNFDEAMELFREWNVYCAEPNWSEAELTHKLHDAYAKVLR